MLWAEWDLAFPLNSKGTVLDSWDQTPLQQPWPGNTAGCCTEFASSHPNRDAVWEQPPLLAEAGVLTGTRLVPPLPCR